ncbi:hypothetical protein CSKR_109581, partial [Clonorchis sinensis]
VSHSKLFGRELFQQRHTGVMAVSLKHNQLENSTIERFSGIYLSLNKRQVFSEAAVQSFENPEDSLLNAPILSYTVLQSDDLDKTVTCPTTLLEGYAYMLQKNG